MLNDFAEIPEKTRKVIVLKAMSSPRHDLVKWLAACINNHRRREQEKRILSSLHLVA